MKTLFRNGSYVNVFTREIEKANVLVEDDHFAGIGSYCEEDADAVVDITGQVLCPGFIDGHIHIESSMLVPSQFAGACALHGTAAVVADPHEIANVCGPDGINFMLQASEGLPIDFYFTAPSCVPGSEFDENGAVITGDDIKQLLSHPRVIGLAEVMDYPGVIAGNAEIISKIRHTTDASLVVNGHAPMLTGRDLDRYIAAGVSDDHECTSAEEAMERIRKGQIVMIRQGTAAMDLAALLPLFEEPWSGRCILVTDDKHASDLINIGHIDSIIRKALKRGKKTMTGVRMATIQAAEYYGLRHHGAIAPGYKADFMILDEFESLDIRDVYHGGRCVVKNGVLLPYENRPISDDLIRLVHSSFSMKEIRANDLMVKPTDKKCRIIHLRPHELITDEVTAFLNFADGNNGIDTGRDILKIAVIERHRGTGHIGLGFISGTGMKRGAICSSVSHDSHNIVVIGANESDMAFAVNHVMEIGGGLIVADSGRILAELPLPVAGLMSEEKIADVVRMNDGIRKAAATLGNAEGIDLFMNMAFVTVTAIPHLKITTLGLVDVDGQTIVPLEAE